MVEHLRSTDVTGGNGQMAGSVCGRRFFHQVVEHEHFAGLAARLGDAEFRQLVGRDLAEGNHRVGSLALELLDHPRDNIATVRRSDDRIAQGHHERTVFDHRPRAEHGVSQSQRLPLPGVKILDVVALEGQLREQVFLARLAQVGD